MRFVLYIAFMLIAATTHAQTPIHLVQRGARAAQAAGGAFDPSSLSGHILDLRRSTGYYTDSACTTAASAGSDTLGCVEDNSTAGNDITQATAANEPSYTSAGIGGGTSIDFDGTNDELVMASNQALTAFTLVCAVLMDAHYKNLFGGAGENNSYIYFPEGGVTTLFSDESFTSSGWSSATATEYLVSIIYDGTDLILRVDGAQQDSDPISSKTFNLQTLGADRTGGNWDGDVCGCQVYSAAYSGSNLTDIESFVETDCGI